jgi:hypothetical protein
MQEIPARAALVSAPDVAKGLTTSISRAELEQAIGTKDGPAELVLDVTRFSDGEAAETRKVAVAWQPGDLERLLREAEGERVTLTFDGEALRQAMEDDVEAHGLREKAVVLAVAATGLTGIAAGAAAADSSLVANDRAHSQSTAVIQPSQDIDPLIGDAIRAEQAAPQLDPLIGDAIRADKAGSLGADDRALPRTDPLAQPPSLSPDDRAFPRTDPVAQPSLGPDDRALPRTDPVSQPSLGPDDRALPRSAPEPVAQQPGLSPDDRALPRTDPVSQPSLGPDDRALPRESPAPVAQQPGLSPDDRAFPRTDPVSQPSLGPDDRALPRMSPVSQPQPVSSSDDGTFIEAPSPETIALVGGIALAITGAAFAASAASRRRVGPA